MADIPEVKWIKIVVGIFDDEKIKLIDDMPDRDSLLVIWFKLLCLAGRTNNSGVLMLTDRIPYTDEMLSSVFRRPLNTVRLALNVFESFGMVNLINETITIPNWGKHQSIDSDCKRTSYMKNYMREYREKQQQIAASSVSPEEQPVNLSVNSVNVYSKPNVNTAEKEEELEVEEEKEKDKGTICTEPPSATVVTLILNDKSEYPITEKDVAEYSELYPAVDVMQELRKMKGWCKDNPAKRKTRKGVRRFINNWLSSEQDKGGSFRRNPQRSAPVSGGDRILEMMERGDFDQ